MAKIYLIHNKLNDKKYVGETTRTVAMRFAEHIASSRDYKKKQNCFYKEIFECGEEAFNVFEYTILEECDDEDRFIRELYYISKIKPEYNEMGKQYSLYLIKDKIAKEYLNGSNITTLRQKYKCRHNFMTSLLKSCGITLKKSLPTQYKKVYLFDDDGKIIKEWINAGECAKELNIDRGNIRFCCIKNTKNNYLYNTANGYHFKYNNDTPIDMYEITNENETLRFKSKNALMNFFKQKFPNKRIVVSQLTRNRERVYGYKIIVLYNRKNKEIKIPKTRTTKRKVNKLNLNGIYIKTYDSIKDACKDNNIKGDGCCISACCRGLQLTAYGYKWEYADE